MLTKELANVNFKTQVTNITPLTLAVRNGRQSIVQKLLKSKVDVNHIPADGLSQLTIASRLGNLDLMKQLVTAGSDANDGSLHDAARYLRPDAIRLLVTAGHKTEFPSTRHDGRSALAELCSKAPIPTTASQEQFLKRTMKSLIECGAKTNFRHHGKSLLFLALDSASCIPVTRALLDFMWETINDDVNMYTSRGYTYSAIAYVEMELTSSPRSNHPTLIKLLRDKGATRIYFSHKPPQPAGYEGAPQRIVEAQDRWEAEEEKKRRIEEEHQRRLRHEEEIANQIMKQSYREHRLKLDQEAQRVQAQITHRETLARKELEIEESRERQAAIISRNKRSEEVEHVRILGEAQLRIRERELDIQREHKQSMLRIQAQEHEKNVRLIEMQTEGTRERQRLVERQHQLANLAIQAGMSPSNTQRAIGYIEEL